MDIYRLRLAVGDLKTNSEYLEMAQQALLVGYPAEAKMVVEKGLAAKALQSGERIDRLTKMTGDRVTQDSTGQADLQKKATAVPTAGVQLGRTYWTFGKNKQSWDAP